MRTKSIYAVLGLAALVGLGACSDRLEVTNLNSADRDRALATPADVESVIRGSWNALHAGIHHTNDALYPQMLTMGMENLAELANFGMGPRGGIPRTFIDNNRGNQVQAGNYRDFAHLHRASRLAAVGLTAFQREGFSIGSPDADARAKAFAKFTMGVAHGYLAAAYDSAAIISEEDDPEAINPLAGYKEVHEAALRYLQEAIDIATAGPNFNIPANWFATAGAVSRDEFIRIVRSYRARIRAMVARTPAERAALPWNEIMADAENGITSDLMVQMLPPGQGGSWDMAWFAQHFAGSNWHLMWSFMVGMADTSGAYDAWLRAPRGQKTRFLVVTPDRRFPRGETRAEQQANSPVIPPAGQYFRNIPDGEDVDNEPLGRSMYQHARFRAFRDANRIGPFPYFQVAELNLLRAEGHIRMGQVAQAAALIDVTRVGKGGLPPLTGAVTSVDDPVPGGNACVPRVPTSERTADYAWPNGSKCGNIMEALKWEKRMELAFTTWGAWYFDSRGWGDLPENTPIHWMVPWQEADTRRMPIYHGGDPARGDAAARGTYGL
ncbi:MAG TPA: hypothetical protein VKZ58_06875 [Longimicrobiales bacterium]|nr:hypothetical protein [Longimicrobiales bacterium]